MSEPGGPISVIVCTHNGARSLPAALAALGRQGIDDEFELVIVDDRSTDGSAEVAAAAGAVVVRMEANGGLAAARNAGVQAASGEIIAFTDDDCEPETTWLAELLEPFADSLVDGAAGRTVPKSDETLVFRYLALRSPLAPLRAVLLNSRHPLFRLWIYLREGLGPSPQLSSGCALYSVAGANMAFRRRLLESVGGFDGRIKFGGEEEDLCRRAHLREGGARFVYAPRAVVLHHYQRGLRDTLRRARAYGRGNARQAIANEGSWPIVYPFPLLLAVTLWFASIQERPPPLLVALLPVLFYPGWLRYGVRHRKGEILLFPYLQLFQEVATMVGEVDAYMEAWGQ